MRMWAPLLSPGVTRQSDPSLGQAEEHDCPSGGQDDSDTHDSRTHDDLLPRSSMDSYLQIIDVRAHVDRRNGPISGGRRE